MSPRTSPGKIPGHPGPDRPSPGLPLLLLIGGVIGTLASGILTYDRIRTLEDPLFTPGCNVNAVLSCGDVMTTWQGNLLGFPNMLLGIAGFAALAGLGAALVAGAVFPRWLWRGLWVGIAGGFAFTLWLISQCLYVIGALCPWCMVVWAVVIPLFWYVTRHLAPACSRLRALPHWLVPLAAYGVLTALILTEFGERLL
ncbi:MULTISPECIES: vitamin K epoxide reductase family protein [unclassified Streptomyces]|uniref:vitamin K epoxide reductase family protein n=1 Tax=unclassified Streptomyces TaxID=2593676 RepID=UPI000DC7AC5D|nr:MULTISPECIES: vitamin K epoxide reductase family protein [unclassified Streptomyces]AWZ03782.1 vitamin K epoxide reductase [Streptomyces sp. ICC4]AWZ11377.1 vitamin K epoxide reductase [Streptomyces sp. ICC1]